MKTTKQPEVLQKEPGRVIHEDPFWAYSHLWGCTYLGALQQDVGQTWKHSLSCTQTHRHRAEASVRTRGLITTCDQTLSERHTTLTLGQLLGSKPQKFHNPLRQSGKCIHAQGCTLSQALSVGTSTLLVPGWMLGKEVKSLNYNGSFQYSQWWRIKIMAKEP